MPQVALKITTIYWRDIPAQVIAKAGRKRVRKLLEARFQEAIDHAAMRAKKTDADAYLDDWRRVSSSEKGELNTLVEKRVKSLEQEYDIERLNKIVRKKGIDADLEK